MLEVDAFEAQKRLAALLDLVERGEEVVIKRHGKPVAGLVRATRTEESRQRARAAAEALRILSKGVTTGGHSIRSMIDEGRR